MPAAAGILQHLAPDATACFSFVIPTPVPRKRLSRGLSRRCSLLPAAHKGRSATTFINMPSPCMRNEQVSFREWGSHQGCCLSLGQMHPRWAQKAEAPTKRTISDFVWRHVTIIYRKEKVILQYWSYSAASKMTGMTPGQKTSAKTTKCSAQPTGKPWKAGLCLADPQNIFPNTCAHKPS